MPPVNLGRGPVQVAPGLGRGGPVRVAPGLGRGGPVRVPGPFVQGGVAVPRGKSRGNVK